MTGTFKKNYIWWVTAFCWCMVIFYQSSKNAELSDMNSLFIVDLINQMLVSIFGSGAVSISNFIVRKSAHFIEYMVLGGLLFKSLFNGLKLKTVTITAFLCGLGYSITDEIHQIFVPGRTAKILDVLIDSTGIASGLLLICMFTVWRQRRLKTKKLNNECQKTI
ncbi:MAG TPA: VanZ family protein [Chitinispirillaceae bacterium]|nr:VanZ family protein [Chitinispirillaceae bacterium]